MRGLIYWTIIQIITGIWLFISPFVMEFREEAGVTVNNMVCGVILVILALGVSLHEFYNRETLGAVEHMQKRGV